MRTVQSELQRHKLALAKNDEAPKKPRKEQLAKWEIEELMGMNMPTYKRGKGGAMRRNK